MTRKREVESDARPLWVRDLASGREPAWTAAVAGFLLLTGWLGGSFFDLPDGWATLAFAGSCLAGGAFSLSRTIQSLARRRLDIDLLMLLSALGAAAIGELAEGATLLFLFSLSNSLESRALARTTRAIESLMELRPDEASELLGDGSERRVPVEQLEAGQSVRVRPGERVPVDGRIVAGTTAVDQAAITGESVPAPKEPGDEIFAGAINIGGTVEIEVLRPASESTLARIIALVEEAREARAPTQRFIDRFEQGYAATVIVAAVAASLIPIAFGEPLQSSLYRAMTLLVVASPCAVVISTPATILAALAHAARKGLLFKGGAPLEELANIEVFAFDKTGTLTEGRPTVTRVLPFAGADPGELLARAAAVERLSEHHLGKAILDAATAGSFPIPTASGLVNHRGQGAVAQIGNEIVAVGKADFVVTAARLSIAAEDRRAADALQREGRTVVFVASSAGSGVIAVEDRVRADAAAAVSRLRELGVRRTLLLTGDNAAVAERVASKVGILEWHADLLPEDKVATMQNLTRHGEGVAMVGDGVNDAPALASSTVGVAMGLAGTDAALETADLVLVRDELAQLGYAVELARRSRRVVRQNLAFACSVIAILVVVNLTQGLPLPLGVVAHEGSTILVVLNGLRLLRPLSRPKR